MINVLITALNNELFNYFTSDSSSSSDEEEVQQAVSASAPEVLPSIPLTSNRTPKVKKSVSKIAKPILQVKNIGGKKSQGHRQARRHENSLLMIITPSFTLAITFDFSVFLIEFGERSR